MIFQPIFNPIVLTVVFSLVAIASIFLIVRRPVNRWSWVRRLFGIILVFVMCLRPGIGETTNATVYTNQYDVYFVVDTTASMVAEDWDNGATRLSGVKEDISRLVDDYTGAKFSLITYDSQAVIRTPLTKDATALMTSVHIMSPEITRNSHGSNPWEANEPQADAKNGLLTNVLSADYKTQPDRARLVFVFTDGERTSSQQSNSTFKPVAPYINGGYVYGYGTSTGGKMKVQNGYFITSSKDEYIMDKSQNPPKPALSKIDEKNLKLMAAQLGVSYEHRNGSKVVAAPAIKPTTTNEKTQSQLKVFADYSWVIGLILFMLLLFEFANILVVRIRLKTRGGYDA